MNIQESINSICRLTAVASLMVGVTGCAAEPAPMGSLRVDGNVVGPTKLAITARDVCDKLELKPGEERKWMSGITFYYDINVPQPNPLQYSAPDLTLLEDGKIIPPSATTYTSALGRNISQSKVVTITMGISEGEVGVQTTCVSKK
ncbi:MAG: hypothetical protein WCJ70_05070 [bacterium]